MPMTDTLLVMALDTQSLTNLSAGELRELVNGLLAQRKRPAVAH